MRKLTEVHANDEVLVEWKQMAFENMQSHGWILNVYWEVKKKKNSVCKKTLCDSTCIESKKRQYYTDGKHTHNCQTLGDLGWIIDAHAYFRVERLFCMIL